MNKLIITIIVILVTSVSFAFAAPKSKSKKLVQPSAKQEPKKAKVSKNEKYTDKQIDLTVLQLPPIFFGNDPSKVHAALKRGLNASSKGEFETTQQYQKRINDEKTLPLVGNIGKDGLLAFQTVIKEYSGTGDLVFQKFSYIKYSADDSEFDISLNLESINAPLYETEEYNKNAKTVLLPTGKCRTRRYVASNAYGATINVEEYVCNEFYAAINNPDDFPFSLEKGKYNSRYSYEIHTKLKSRPEEAKEIKHNIRFLLIGNIAEPYTSSAFVHSKPTRDKPTELTLTKYFIYLNVKEIWIYNQATGQIYNKIKKKNENQAVNTDNKI